MGNYMDLLLGLIFTVSAWAGIMGWRCNCLPRNFKLFVNRPPVMLDSMCCSMMLLLFWGPPGDRPGGY